MSEYSSNPAPNKVVFYDDTIEALRAENARLKEALNRLVNEVSGSWGAFEFVLRQELGNTNYACVKDKLEAARAAIEEKN